MNSLIACHDCDLLQKLPPLAMGVVVECQRCGAILRRTQANSLNRTLGWLTAGLVFYCVAVSFPFLAIQAKGISNETAMASGILLLYKQGMGGLGLVVLLTCLLFPLFTLLSLLYILLPLRIGYGCLPGTVRLFVWSQRLRHWGMMEVYLLGILVSMIKLSKMAQIIPGPSLFSFIALIFVLAASAVSLDSHLVWDYFRSLPPSDSVQSPLKSDGGSVQSSLPSDEDPVQSPLKLDGDEDSVQSTLGSDGDSLQPPPPWRFFSRGRPEGIQFNPRWGGTRTTEPSALSPLPITARRAHLLGCPNCHLLTPTLRLRSGHRLRRSLSPQGDSGTTLRLRSGTTSGEQHCPRCRTALNLRKVNSLGRCWALVLASYILYLPANLLPVTVTTAFGRPPHSDTIMSGIIYFLQSGSWHIALIIFVASIFVPLMKLFILTFLLLSLHLGWRWRPLERTRLYRLTEIAGRWSMVDIYVVTILVALVKLGAMANVEAGPGASYFAALVILTMLAAESFDPRLMWDQVEDNDDGVDRHALPQQSYDLL